MSDMTPVTDDAPAPPLVPLEQRCVWPGCPRRRAQGRASGSGRQKEYCLLADPPEEGGGPVHNARNRWAALRGADQRAAGGGGLDAGSASVGPEDDPATRLGRAGQADGGMGGTETAASVPDHFLFSAAKRRASVLLEQARRQHAAAVESLHAERELYQRLGEQLTVLTDPASLDLEIAAITSQADRDVAQAAEEAARARGAQLAAERERDDAILLRAHADGAAEQLAADADAAEHALAERTAEFEHDREVLLARASDAEGRAATAAEDSAAAAAVVAEAARSVSEAREQAREEIAAALARADDLATQARRQAAEAVAEARRDTAAARDDAERERGAAQQAREDAARAREELGRERDDAQHRIAAAQADTATATAQAAAAAAQEQRLQAEIDRHRVESGRRDSGHAAELARLDAAHRTALDAERARTARAEAGLDALRADGSSGSRSS